MANDYGVKFKALEALADGIPLLASVQMLLGLPHLPDGSQLWLDDATGSAARLAHLLREPDAALALSQLQSQAHAAWMAGQQGVWSRVLQATPA